MRVRLTLAFLTGLCGCSTAANIHLVAGGRVEARIQSSDPENLFVRAGTGVEVPIPREEISEVDHPGNVVAVIGGVLSAYGAINIARGGGTCGRAEMAVAACLGVFLPGTIGTSMLVWGLKTWLGSVHAADSSRSQDSLAR